MRPSRLLEKRAIPHVAAKLAFIESLRDEATWTRATIGFVETVRGEQRLSVFKWEFGRAGEYGATW